MSVRGTAVVHCHGKDKGKVIKRFNTREKALAMHQAIMANKNKAKKLAGR